MDKEIREALFERMHTYGSEFGLMHLTYPSFRQITSYTTTVTAGAPSCRSRGGSESGHGRKEWESQ